MKLTIYTRPNGGIKNDDGAVETFTATGEHYRDLLPEVFSRIPDRHYVTSVHLDRARSSGSGVVRERRAGVL
jgi:hypothetical protein